MADDRFPTQSLRTPVFTLSERFARQYNLKNPKKPSGISGQIPVSERESSLLTTYWSEST